MKITADLINSQAVADTLNKFLEDMDDIWCGSSVPVFKFINAEGRECEVSMIVTDDEDEFLEDDDCPLVSIIKQ